jgi:hypothetical protein
LIKFRRVNGVFIFFSLDFGLFLGPGPWVLKLPNAALESTQRFVGFRQGTHRDSVGKKYLMSF